MLTNRKAREDFALLSREMLARKPKSLELLKRILLEAAECGTPEQVITAADALLEVAQAVDLSILLQREDDDDGPARKEAEAAKDALITAQSRKAEALVRSLIVRAANLYLMCY